MMKYRRKTFEVEAVVWNQHGDHEAVEEEPPAGWANRTDNKDIGRGYLKTSGHSGQVIYPGDVIIDLGQGEFRYQALSPEEFNRQFEPVEAAA